jgi:predicted Zn-dependent protease
MNLKPKILKTILSSILAKLKPALLLIWKALKASLYYVEKALAVVGLALLVNLFNYCAIRGSYGHELMHITYLPGARAANDANVQQIFNDITSKLPYEARSRINLVISDSPLVNAWADSMGTVTITRPMLAFVNYDPGSIAAVLGHEVSHVVLGHVGNINENSLVTMPVWQELMADDLGIWLAISSGYKGCNIIAFYHKMREENGDQILATDHPTDLFREQNLIRFCQRVQ